MLGAWHVANPQSLQQLKITSRKQEGAIFLHQSFTRQAEQKSTNSTGGLDWWTDIFCVKTTFVLSNETSLSCRFSDDAFSLYKPGHTILPVQT